MPDRKIREAARFSARLENVSREAELMFWRFLTVPDDYGIYPADPAELRSAIWPANRRHVRIPDVARWRDELVQAGVLGLFDADGARFVELMRFGQARGMKWPRRRFPRPPTAPPDAPGQEHLALEEPVKPTEEKEKRGARKARKPAPNTLESQDSWLSGLQARWPAVDVKAELVKALRRKPDLERLWFAEHWLPNCSPQVDRKTLAAPAAAVEVEPEPDDWRAVLAGSVYGPGQERAVDCWAQLPPEARRFVFDELKRERVA